MLRLRRCFAVLATLTLVHLLSVNYGSTVYGFVVLERRCPPNGAQVLLADRNNQDVAPSPSSSPVHSHLQALLSAMNNDAHQQQSQEEPSTAVTTVHLLGTGITGSLWDLPLSSLALLARADVILYDALSLRMDDNGDMDHANSGGLNLLRSIVAKKECILECVGKRGGSNRSWTQADIDSLLVDYAVRRLPAGSTVVRLKGGDPFLFGRARTEVEALRAQQQPSIRYTVTPGLSSCIAGPHFAGIPLTDPVEDCQSFAVLSGTDKRGMGAGNDDDRQWANVEVDTLVFLMIGRLANLRTLCCRIAETGGKRWDETTPCAIVQNAGRIGQQRVFRGSLSTLVDNIQGALGEANNTTATSVSPAILVVGKVAALNLLDHPSLL